MSEFIENIKNKKIYDTELLYKELENLKQIERSGEELIEKYILKQRLNTNKIEFGVLDNCFYIQVLVQTFKQDRYTPIEMDKFKFVYPLEHSRIILPEIQSIKKKIFYFYLTKTLNFLSDLNIRHT